MLAYAASRPVVADRPSSPSTLLIVIGLHAAVLAAVVSAKMDLPGPIWDPPIRVKLIPTPKPPPERPVTQPNRPQTNTNEIDHTTAVVPIERLGPVTVDQTQVDPGPIVGPPTYTNPDPPRPVELARSDARLLTPAWDLKPPYPASKIASEEEAVLQLRITIDERGRVIAVEPLGRVDPAFLQSARRHLLSHWRYKPAIEGGRPVTTSMVIRLRFQLDG
jgi:protein TonB